MRINGKLSHEELLTEGCPEGGISSQTYFSISCVDFHGVVDRIKKKFHHDTGGRHMSDLQHIPPRRDEQEQEDGDEERQQRAMDDGAVLPKEVQDPLGSLNQPHKYFQTTEKYSLPQRDIIH